MTLLSKRSRNIGTSPTLIGAYTVPVGKRAVLTSVTAANTTAAPIAVTVAVNNATLTNIFFCVDTTVGVGQALVVAGRKQGITLQEGDSIMVVSDTASSVDAQMSFEESPSVAGEAVDTIEYTVWTSTQKALAVDAASSDTFGYSVACSADGAAVLVGARAESTAPTTNNGAVYVLDKSGGVWTHSVKLIPLVQLTGANFGTAVACTPNASVAGGLAFIGATGENSQQGAVYVYTRTEGLEGWAETQRFTASDVANEDLFGSSIACSDDGNTVFVGALQEDTAPNTDNGAVYVFTNSGGTWSQVQKLLASDRANSDAFGASLACSTDGSVLFVGARTKNAGATSFNGAVYVFTKSGATWTEAQKLLASDTAVGEFFGYSVACSSDGSVLFVGALNESTTPNSNNGAVYVFTKSGATWGEAQKLLASDRTDSAQLGRAVACTSDGSRVFIGAPGTSDSPATSGSGAVYVFVEGGASWTEQQKLIATDRANNDFLGESVICTPSGSFVFSGAIGEDTAPNTSNGAVYIFTGS